MPQIRRAVPVLIAFALATSARAQDAPELPLPEGALSIEEYSAASDGRVVFEAVFDEDIDLEPSRMVEATNLFLVAADGTVTQLTEDKLSRDPAFSPAGDQIAFVSNDDLVVLSLAEGERTLLVDGGPDEEIEDEYSYVSYYSPSWSPDGTLIAFFTSSGATSVAQVVRVDTHEIVHRSDIETYGMEWTESGDLRLFEQPTPTTEAPTAVVPLGSPGPTSAPSE